MKQLENLESNSMANMQTTDKCTCKHFPLTDEQIENIFNNWPTYHLDHEEFARAIEAAHGIKENT